jgi:hypothetical protein
MPYGTWQEAAAELRERGAGAGTDQKELAAKLGLKLPRGVPALVAAQLIREHLASPLRATGPDDVSAGQEEYLHDLVEDLNARQPKPAHTGGLASAWIEALENRRALRALKELKPQKGDVIGRINRPEEVGVVVSVSGNGRINVSGSGGRGIPAHLATIEARAGDTGLRAQDVRRRAANLRATRARDGREPSPAMAAILNPYRVSRPPSVAEVALLRDAVESARDEKPIQKCLQEHPELLSRVPGPTSYGTYVRSQVSLGGQLVPDFMIAVADSAGVHWTLVELESPTAKVAIRRGRLAGKAREGVQQIEDWREWVLSNLDFARRSPDDNGLGLVGLRPESPGIVIIGRRGDAPAASVGVRRRLLEQRNIRMHSHDWLLDAVDPAEGFRRAGGPLDWPDWVARY